MGPTVLSEQDLNVNMNMTSLEEDKFKEYDRMHDVMGQSWVEDGEEVWRLATVRSVSSDGKTLYVLNADEETTCTVDKEKSHPFDPSHAINMDDLAHLNNMHEAPLLHVLKRRFREDKIYTICSDVLISINPYKKIPLLYDLDRATAIPVQEQGHLHHPLKEAAANNATAAGAMGQPSIDVATTNEERRPHVYTVAARAFRFMTEPNEALLLGKTVALKNQSVIISGESGAGKTEASKYVMRYLITVANALQHSSSHGAQTKQQHGGLIEKCLLRSNTVLEAFGNAKTLRNDNSSRFGKYIKLQYDSKRELVGAGTDHFLLEKSRLVHVDLNERNYHIFYQMLRGLDEETRKALFLCDDPKEYAILAQGNCVSLEDVDDADEFGQVCEALTTLGVSEEEKAYLWRLLAILLHLGNLEYHGGPEDDPNKKQKVQLTSKQLALADLADLLGTKAEDLINGITTRSTSTATESLNGIPLERHEAANNVHAVIKYVYGEAFAWITRKINSCHSNMTSGLRAASFIGILDIFGFEIMTKNSFEQLCINFANEVLQQQFNMHVFVLEQQEYSNEELDWSVISFRDNQPVIDLIAKKPKGLLIMLEEQALLNRKVADNKEQEHNRALLVNYNNTHYKAPAKGKPKKTDNKKADEKGEMVVFDKPLFNSKMCFIIKHFAGDVQYDITDFIEKNNDSLHDDLLNIFRNSENPFFKNLFGAEPTPNTPGYIAPLPAALADTAQQLDMDGNPIGGGAAAAAGRSKAVMRGRTEGGPRAVSGAFTVSCTFRRQLDELTATLKATEPHYIKCIKPNAIKAPGGFSSRLVVQQLRYSGVLEVVRIRREAYPTRILFEEFYRRFDVLLGSSRSTNLRSAKDYRNACKAIVTQVLPVGGFQVGKRKMFLRDNGIDMLQTAIRDYHARHAARIQATIRGFLGVRRYRKAQRSIQICQKFVRMYLLRKRYLRHRGHIVRIQADWRRHHRLQQYRALKKGALAAQKCTRRWLAMRLFSRKAREHQVAIEQAATKLVAIVRGFFARRWRKREVAATRLAAAARGFLARRWYERDVAAIRIASGARGFLARRWWKREIAATRIAAGTRGYLARRRVRSIHCSIAIVAWLRCCLARRKYLAQKKACIKLQAVTRMMVAVRELRRRRAVLRIQTAARAWAARKMFCTLRTQARLKREHEERQAALAIQARYKAYQMRTQFLAWRKSAVILQTSTRGHLARHHRARAIRSVICIQTAQRRHQCRVQYILLLASICLQTAARRYGCQRKFLQLRAALHIQARFRGWRMRKRYVEYKAATRVQARFRGWRMRKRYVEYRSAVAIQAPVRGRRMRKRYVEYKSAVAIQAVTRGYLQRLRYTKSRGIVLLQAFYRGSKARTEHYRRLWAVYVVQRAGRNMLAYRMKRQMIEEVHACAKTGQAARLKRIVLETPWLAETSCRQEHRRTLFHSAAAAVDSGVLRILDPHLQDICARDENGDTPLHVAAENMGIDVARYLSAVCDGPAAVAHLKARLEYGGTSPMRRQGSPRKVRVHRGTFRISSIGMDSLEVRRQYVREAAASSSHPAGAAGAIASSIPSRPSSKRYSGGDRTPMRTPTNRGQAMSPVIDGYIRSGGLRTPAGRPVLGRMDGKREEIYESGGGRSSRRVSQRRGGQETTILRQGYLKKRRETDRFNRRYCVLTDSDLRYHHSKGEPVSKVISLREAMLKVCDHMDFCFEIHSPLLLDRRNREGRLYFQADSEMELQAWLIKLRLVMGQTTHMYGRRTHPIRYVDFKRRADMVNATNHHDRTPLHVLILRLISEVEKKGTTKGERKKEFKKQVAAAFVEMAMWLIDNGSNVNAQDEDGNTVAHLIVKALSSNSDSPYKELLEQFRQMLLQKGADFRLRNYDQYSANDLIARMRNKTVGSITRPTKRHLLPRPAQLLPGCSYVSFYVEALMGDEHIMKHLFLSPSTLTISVFSGKQHQVEESQVMNFSVTRTSKKFVWGWTWHMQTPIEHLPPGSFAVFEFSTQISHLPPSNQGKDASPAKPPAPPPSAPQSIAWAVLHLSDTRVDSTLVVDNWEMYQSPVDPKLQRMEPSHYFLQGEMWISRSSGSFRSHG